MKNRIFRALKFSAFAVATAAVIGFVATPDTATYLGKAFGVGKQPQSVVRVHSNHNDRDSNSEHGSGVLIRSDLVLTAHHVVRDILTKDGTLKNGATVEIEFKNGLTKSGSVVKYSKDLDLALLQFDSVLFVPARPADRPAAKEQPVTICGFPKNGEYDERSGRVVGFRGSTRTSKPDLFVVNIRCDSGMSGGPVFNPDGEVVGTLFGTLRFANCTGLDAIREFINEDVPRQKSFGSDSEITGSPTEDSTRNTFLQGQGQNHSAD